MYLRLLPLFSDALFATFETTTFFSSPMLFTIVLRLLARKISFIAIWLLAQNIWVVHPRTLILIFYPSRIPDPGIKKAPDPGSGTLIFYSSRIPDPGIKKAPDPGSGTMIEIFADPASPEMAGTELDSALFA